MKSTDGGGGGDLAIPDRKAPQLPPVVMATPVPDLEANDEAMARAMDQEQRRALQHINDLEVGLRLGFVRKVFAIVALQLMILIGVVSLFMYTPSIKAACNPDNPDGTHNPDSTYTLFGFGLLMLFSMMTSTCCGNLHRQYPYNLIIAGWIAACSGAFFGTLAVRVGDPVLVYICFGGALLTLVVLSLFACQTRYDFSGVGPYLLIALVLALFFGIMGGAYAILGLIWAAFVCLIFGIYVIYDVQLVIGGKHRRFSFGVDDAGLASIAIFTDFVMIFGLLLCGASMTR